MAKQDDLAVVDSRDLDTTSMSKPASRSSGEVDYPKIAERLIFDEKAWQQMMRRCEVICQSGLYGLKRPEHVMAIALKGFAIGLDFMRSLETIKIIHGTPTIRGPAAVTLVRERAPGATIRCIESTEQRAVWEMGNQGEEPRLFTATIEEVNKADLPNKNPLWRIYPRRILKWHAASEGVQEVFGHVLHGVKLTEAVQAGVYIDTELTGHGPVRLNQAGDVAGEEVIDVEIESEITEHEIRQRRKDAIERSVKTVQGAKRAEGDVDPSDPKIRAAQLLKEFNIRNDQRLSFKKAAQDLTGFSGGRLSDEDYADLADALEETLAKMDEAGDTGGA